MQKNRKKRYQLTATLLAGVSYFALGGNLVHAANLQANVENVIAHDEATKQLQHVEEQVRKPTASNVRIDNITVPITEVTIDSSGSLNEAGIRSLLPELNHEKVNIHRLS